MSMHICPQCKQVTLGVDDDAEIKCPICETRYQVETGGSLGENKG